MIRQPNSQSYIKVFYYVTLPQLSIPNNPQSPYYKTNTSKLIILNNNNNNNNLIYGRK
jgi:hypothetical protein